jgi:hypothetical protein
MPDLMWNLDMYARLDLADAWAIIGPVNWYGPSSNLKAMFDRLVCMNGGNPREDLIGHKEQALAIALEKSPAWEELSLNHLEGRTAAFFCYGDGGGDELDDEGRPKILEHKKWFDPEKEPFENMRDAYAPIVWQCRYSGLEVPDRLWQYVEFGREEKYSDNQAEHLARDAYAPIVWQCRYSGLEVPDRLWQYVEFGRDEKYSDNQAEHLAGRPKVLEQFDAWTETFQRHVEKKGRIRPGKYRAYGYHPPSHLWADLKTKWRGLRMALGIPIPGTSPEIQQKEGLNRDTGVFYKRGEGKKVRD